MRGFPLTYKYQREKGLSPIFPEDEEDIINDNPSVYLKINQINYNLLESHIRNCLEYNYDLGTLCQILSEPSIFLTIDIPTYLKTNPYKWCVFILINKKINAFFLDAFDNKGEVWISDKHLGSISEKFTEVCEAMTLYYRKVYRFYFKTNHQYRSNGTKFDPPSRLKTLSDQIKRMKEFITPLYIFRQNVIGEGPVYGMLDDRLVAFIINEDDGGDKMYNPHFSPLYD